MGKAHRVRVWWHHYFSFLIEQVVNTFREY
jgi:hypothetical protein